MVRAQGGGSGGVWGVGWFGVFLLNTFHRKRADVDALSFCPCAGRGTCVAALPWEHSDPSGRTRHGSAVLGQVRLQPPHLLPPLHPQEQHPAHPERPFLQRWEGTRWAIPAAFSVSSTTLRNSTENPAPSPGASRSSRGSGTVPSNAPNLT